MSNLPKKALSMVLVMVMVSSAFLLFISMRDEDVDAKMSNPDGAGYIYVDNKDPDPKIEFDWIDATQKGEYLDEAWSYYRQNTYQDYDLPFSFPFYGEYYDECKVCAYGMVDFGAFYNYYYLGSYGIPYTGYENGMIAVWAYAIGGYYYYGSGDFQIFALEGESFGERWVCFEWYKALAPGSYGGQPNYEQYEITFEVIIYESGIIKMQYLDATSSYGGYSNGGYATVGIESADGKQGTQYTGYSEANLVDGLAVMYGENLMEVTSATIDTDNGGVMYSEHKDYTITADVVHPVSMSSIKVVSATLGECGAAIAMFYNNDGSYAFSEVDPNGYVTLNPDDSYIEMDPEGRFLRVFFKFSPGFAYPTSLFQDAKVQAMGAGAMPGGFTIQDAFWVENKLDLAGSLEGFSEERGFLGNGGWVHGNEHFQFRGVSAVYPSTALSPRPGAHTFTVTDEQGNRFVQDYVEGSCQVDVVSENDYTRKTYNLTISGIPPGTDISDGLSYVLNIDPFKPLPPQEVLIHADSYDDKNVEFDDDNEVFITWQPAEDFESGIEGYFVATFDPLEPEAEGQAIWVKSPDTSTRVTFDGLGARRVWVWSVDRAGNPSVPSFAVTKIDMDGVDFSEFSPGHQVWVNTHTPVASILVSDNEGSGVSAKDLQYSVSTTTTDEYNAWQPGKSARDANEVRLSVPTVLKNGKDNWIRFRAKDVAGNGWTQSMDQNIWVDEEKPNFVNFRPYESEYQNGATVVVSLDVTDVHGGREGSGIDLETLEYRFTKAGKGLYGDWSILGTASVTSAMAHVELTLDLNEGDQNYIQIRCYDNVGNFATSREYNLKVNSAPDVSAFIAEPKNGFSYVSTEKILFDASETEDPDGDALDYTWYSDIDRLLSSSPSFFRTLSPGVHTITLIVNDPAHSIVETFEILVLEEEQIDPMSIDTDKDGLYDAWEMKYKLNPFRPDSHLDSDNDMFTNYQEFQNGTDPTSRVSHPPYPIAPKSGSEDNSDIEGQYQSITLVIVLLSLVVVISLAILAFSKHRTFKDEVEEEKELESEEIEYRESIKGRRSERLSMKGEEGR
ncbi:MAG: hypothetical protein U9R75_03760 [Candidatus Thermoplasmatota archaeon]|nr:hypothetical protein [Candidatus Thermoplasmatota archaeon]